MALRASVFTASAAFNSLLNQARSLKTNLEAAVVTMQQPSVFASVVMNVAQTIRGHLSAMDALVTTPGLREYARIVLGDSLADVVADYQDMKTEGQAAITDIIAAFPADGNGWLLYQQLNADGSLTTRSFSNAQIAPLVTRLQSVINTII